MDDVLLVNVLHALQDLLHVAGTGGLRVLEVVIHDAFKELPTCNTGWINNTFKVQTQPLAPVEVVHSYLATFPTWFAGISWFELIKFRYSSLSHHKITYYSMIMTISKRVS